MLRILSEKKTQAFYQNQLHLEKEVLWENENKEGFLFGYTDNYIRVKTPYDKDLANQISQISLADIDFDGYVKVDFIPKLTI